MGPNSNDIKKNPFILVFISSHKDVQLCPIAAENSHHHNMAMNIFNHSFKKAFIFSWPHHVSRQSISIVMALFSEILFQEAQSRTFFCYVPGKELTCRWLQQLIRSQSSAVLLPCTGTDSLVTKSLFPGFAHIYLASWPETDVRYLTTDIGKIVNLCVMGKYKIPLLQNTWVHETVTEMLQRGDVRTLVSSTEAALCCCNGLPLLQALTVISITAIARSFLKYKLQFLGCGLWWVLHRLQSCGQQGLWLCSRTDCAPPSQLTPLAIAVLLFPPCTTLSCAHPLWDQFSSLRFCWATLLVECIPPSH